MCVYVHTYTQNTYAHTYTCIHIYKHAYTNTSSKQLPYNHTHVCIQSYVRICTHIHPEHIRAHIYIHACMHKYLFIRTPIQSYMCMQCRHESVTYIRASAPTVTPSVCMCVCMYICMYVCKGHIYKSIGIGAHRDTLCMYLCMYRSHM